VNGPTGADPDAAPGFHADTHELRFTDASGGQAVTATVLADTLIAAQRVVHFLAMARRRLPLRQRARAPQEIERAFPVLCDTPRPGSYLQPIRIGDPGTSLFSAQEVGVVVEDFDAVLEAAVEGSHEKLAVIVADARWRAAVLDGLVRMVPKPASGFLLSVKSLHSSNDFNLSAHRSRLEALAMRPANTAESRSVIGLLQAIDFGERRLSLRHTKTSRSFNCFYVDDVEPMLLENARQLIQVTGEVELDAQGAPVKVVDTTDIRPVDLDPIVLAPFMVGNVRVEPLAALTLTPELDETEQMFVLQDDAIGIDLIAETRAELDEALQHELRLLWRDYALVSDEKLTRGAQALKRRLLTAFRAVPHAA
jgi:hypothetical protein